MNATCNYRPDTTQSFVWERTKDHVTNGTFAYDRSSHREKIRVNDSEAKSKMKCSADARNSADYRDIKVGDSVVMNRDEYKGKLQPKYERPGIVTDKK